MCGPLRCPRCGSWFISAKPAEKTLRGEAQGHTSSDWPRDATPVPGSLSPVCLQEGRGAVVRRLKPRARRQSRGGGQTPAPEEGGRTRWLSGGQGPPALRLPAGQGPLGLRRGHRPLGFLGSRCPGRQAAPLLAREARASGKPTGERPHSSGSDPSGSGVARAGGEACDPALCAPCLASPSMSPVHGR